MRRALNDIVSKLFATLILIWIVLTPLLRVVSVFIPGVYVSSLMSSALFLLVWALGVTMLMELTPLAGGLFGGGCSGHIFGGIYLYLISLVVPGVTISGIFVSIILSIVLNLLLGIVF